MDTEKDKKKIAIGKDGKKSQIILNPPEITTPVQYKEAFLRALNNKRVVIEKKIEIVLSAKASQAELPVEALEQVYVRGFKTLPLNSNLTREQYAMNRVNSFIAGGAAMVEDCDLLPIVEILHTTVGLKGSGGRMRPHIKREKSPYNSKTIFHVVDAQGRVKHTTSDENEAKKHLATKYNSYMEMTLKPSKRFEGTNSLVKTYKTDTPGEKRGVTEEKMKGEDPCWKGYQMVGKKLKAGREVPNCVPVKEETVNEMMYTTSSKPTKLKTGKVDNTGDTNAKMSFQLFMAKKRQELEKQGKLPVKEATSAAVRMQRALDKIKTERERRERLGAEFVKSVFGKKDEKKPVVKEGLLDDVLASAKQAGLNAKVAPSLADRKKATMKLLKHRAKERAKNPPQARPSVHDNSMSSPEAYYRSKKPGEYTGD